MVWGIPAFRLPPGIIDEDITRLTRRCPGLEVHLNTALGRDVTLAELKERHDAVLLAIGAWWGKPMGIPGEEHEGVIDGVGWLREINAGARPRLPGEGGRRRRRRRGHGRLPRRPAAARLRARAGPLPPGPRGDPGAPHRAGGGDRRGHRVRLPHPAGGRRAPGRGARPQVRAHRVRRARGRRPPTPRQRAGQRARLRVRPGDRVGGAEGGLRRARRAGHDAPRPHRRRLRQHAHHRPQGLRRRRRRLRRLDDRHRHAPRAEGRLLRAQLPRGPRRAPALPHPVPHAPRGGGPGRPVGAAGPAAPGVPRPRPRAGGLPGDREHLRPRVGPQGGGPLLPLRRRDRHPRLQRAAPRGPVLHGPHGDGRVRQAAGHAAPPPGAPGQPLPRAAAGRSWRTSSSCRRTCRAW